MSQTLDYTVENGVLTAVTPNTATEAILPEGIHTIGVRAFCFFTSLVKVRLPSTLKTIGKDAFGYCRKLSNINLPIGITAIEDSAFLRCEALKEITLPDSIETIGKNAFDNCSLERIVFPERLRSIGYMAFWGCPFKELTLSRGIEEIGWGAFGRAPLNMTLTVDCPAAIDAEYYSAIKEVTPFAEENGHIQAWASAAIPSFSSIYADIGFYKSGKRLLLDKKPIPYAVFKKLLEKSTAYRILDTERKETKAILPEDLIFREDRLFGIRYLHTEYYLPDYEHDDYPVFIPFGKKDMSYEALIVRADDES